MSKVCLTGEPNGETKVGDKLFRYELDFRIEAHFEYAGYLPFVMDHYCQSLQIGIILSLSWWIHGFFLIQFFFAFF